MIILEILLVLILLGVAIYFMFFSKSAEKIAAGAKRRNETLTSPESTDAVIERLEKADEDFATAADQLAKRQKELASEQARLDELSRK